MANWYPYGQSSTLSGPVNLQLPMKEKDWLLRCMAACTVTNENGHGAGHESPLVPSILR